MDLYPLHAADYYPTLDRRLPPSLVIFTAPACGACRRLRALLAALPTPPLPDLIVYAVDAEEAPGLLTELEVGHLPALFLYRSGDYHAPVHPQLTPAGLIQAIQAAAAGPRQEPP